MEQKLSSLMDARLGRGIDEFNAGNFFTAHEIWEELWLETVGPEKLLLQGLVQVAAGYAKVETRQRNGALKLLTRGVEKLRQSPWASSGLALEAFVDGVTADVDRLRQAPETSVNLELVRVPPLYRS